MKRKLFDAQKRGFDLLIAIALLVAMSPIMLFIGFLIHLIDGGPVLFVQTRAGKGGDPFTMYKFRTMSNSFQSLEPNLEHERVSSLGQFLRNASLDELPQLWNIVRGDMSFVGPRPLLVDYLPLYDDAQSRRHEVRPGLSGLAQVTGRNNLSWERKFELDRYYIDNRCFRLDLSIVIKTMGVLVARKGIIPEESDWVEPFKGSVFRQEVLPRSAGPNDK